MKDILMYVNLDCSNCRTAISAIEGEGYQTCQVEYLKNPLNSDTLRDLAKKLGMRPKEFIRTKEEIFKSLNLNLENDESVIEAMVNHPILIQRPIIIVGEKAFIGRGTDGVQRVLAEASKHEIAVAQKRLQDLL
jgi:arsenate reductase